MRNGNVLIRLRDAQADLSIFCSQRHKILFHGTPIILSPDMAVSMVSHKFISPNNGIIEFYEKLIKRKHND